MSSSKDTEFLIRHSMLKGYQALSLLTPPLYTIFALRRGGRQAFALNKLLRATWVGGGIGTAAGGGIAWIKLRSQSPESLRDRRTRLMHNTTQIRTDDHSTIGSILFAVLTPALFWNRARMVNLVLGGAGLGSAAGVLTHLMRSTSEGHQVKPDGMIDIIESKQD